MRRLSLLLILLIIAAFIGGGWFVQVAWLSRPEAGASVDIAIERGSSMDKVSRLLEEKGFVVSVAYRLYAKFDAVARRPKAGEYALRRGMSYQQIAQTLGTGPTRPEEEVRIIEATTIDQEAELLTSFGSATSSFVSLAGRSKNAAPADAALVSSYPFLASLPKGASLEGYLFPDTYRVWKDELPAALIRKQLATFSAKVVEPFADAQRRSGLTWHEVVTLASIVEAEVRTPADRKIVAGIFLNRLRNNTMRLQSDATLNYAIGEGRARATSEDLALDSPYNSYTHDGLPPGPIGNPGLSALAAVLEPAQTDYYFFLTDEKGKVYYARTHDEHVRNKEIAF